MKIPLQHNESSCKVASTWICSAHHHQGKSTRQYKSLEDNFSCLEDHPLDIVEIFLFHQWTLPNSIIKNSQKVQQINELILFTTSTALESFSSTVKVLLLYCCGLIFTIHVPLCGILSMLTGSAEVLNGLPKITKFLLKNKIRCVNNMKNCYPLPFQNKHNTFTTPGQSSWAFLTSCFHLLVSNTPASSQAQNISRASSHIFLQCSSPQYCGFFSNNTDENKKRAHRGYSWLTVEKKLYIESNVF